MNKLMRHGFAAIAFLGACGLSSDAADDRAVEQRLKNLEDAIEDLESTISNLEETISELVDQLGESVPQRDRPESDLVWRRLKQGMSRDEVRNLLGEPRSTSVSTYQIKWAPAKPVATDARARHGADTPTSRAADVDLNEVNWHYEADPAGARVVFDANGHVLRWRRPVPPEPDC